MPINLRIILLSIIYIIYLVTCRINCSRVTKKFDDKDNRKVVRQDYSFIFLCRNVTLLAVMFILFPQYSFLSYYKMIVFCIGVFLLMLENIYHIFLDKTKIQTAISVIAILTVMSGVIFLGGRSLLDSKNVNHSLNPSEIVNETYKKTEISDLTVNLYDLKNKKYKGNSIGLKKDEGTYFFYYYDSIREEIIEKEISSTEIIYVMEIDNEKSHIIVEETAYDIIFTEKRLESENYKKSVSEIKYKLYINPEELVEVND